MLSSEPSDKLASVAREFIARLAGYTGMRGSIVRLSLVHGPCVKGNLVLMCKCIEKWWFTPLAEAGNLRLMIHVDDLIRRCCLVAEDG